MSYHRDLKLFQGREAIRKSWSRLGKKISPTNLTLSVSSQLQLTVSEEIPLTYLFSFVCTLHVSNYFIFLHKKYLLAFYINGENLANGVDL